MFGTLNNFWPRFIESLLTSLCELVIKWAPEWEPPGKNTTIPGVLLACCRRYLDNTTAPIEIVDISLISKHILLVLYCIILVISFVGNVSVLIIFVTNKNVRSVTNVFLVSLALSDLLITCFTIPFSILAIFRYTTNNQLQPFTCKVVPYIQNVAATATILTLCCICLERYIAILYPLLARTNTALHRIIGLTLGIWFISLISSVPHAIWQETIYIPEFLVKPVVSISNSILAGNESLLLLSNLPHTRLLPLHFQKKISTMQAKDRGGAPEFSLVSIWQGFSAIYEDIDLSNPPVMSTFYRNGNGLSVCWVPERNRLAYVIYKWTTLGLVFILPALLMSIAYIRIGYRLWDRSILSARKKARNNCPQTTIYPNKFQSDVKTRIAKRVTAMLVVAMFLFVVCWLPHLLFEAIALTVNITSNELTLNVRYYLEWLSVSNSCHNPILYTLLHEKFRRILTSLFGCKKSTVRPEENESPFSSRLPSNDPGVRPNANKSSNDRDSPATVAINLMTFPIVRSLKESRT